MQLQTDAQGLPVNGTMVPQGDDRSLVVIFHKEAVQNNYKSEQEGRPIFDDVDFVKILTPGDRNTVVDRPVKPDDKTRFPQHWAQYLAMGEVATTGTPVEHWPRLTPSQVAEAKHSNIPTVEHLAQMSDSVVSNMGTGWMGLRTEAKAFLDKAKDAATAQHHAAENDRLRGDLRASQELVAELAKRVEALEAKPDKRKAA